MGLKNVYWGVGALWSVGDSAQIMSTVRIYILTQEIKKLAMVCTYVFRCIIPLQVLQQVTTKSLGWDGVQKYKLFNDFSSKIRILVALFPLVLYGLQSTTPNFASNHKLDARLVIFLHIL